MIKLKDLPPELQDFAENLADIYGNERPNFLKSIEGWYEDSHNGVSYLAFVDASTGLTHCHCIANGYRDQMPMFAEWIDSHSKEIEIALDFPDSAWSGYPEKVTVTVVNEYPEISWCKWAVYLKAMLWKGGTVVAVNGKPDGFTLEDDILTLD